MLPMSLQIKICRNYSHLSRTSQLSTVISVLVLFRNTCAHNDRLYNYRSNKVELPPLRLHKELGLIRLPSGNFKQGKQDLFAVIIALRYLLENTNFTSFFAKLTEIITNHPDNSIFTKTELLKDMGFPTNWQEVAVLPV